MAHFDDEQEGLPAFISKFRARSLRSLLLCSNGVRGLGAVVKKLAHSESLCVRVNNRPSHHGIKHLATQRGLVCGPLGRYCSRHGLGNLLSDYTRRLFVRHHR